MLELALLTGIERAEDRGVADAGTRYIVDRVNQHRNAQNVREQDKLLAVVGTHLAGTREEVDGLPPFTLRQLRLPDDRVQMTNDDRRHFAQSGTLCLAHAIDDITCQFREDFHRWIAVRFAGHDHHLAPAPGGRRP